MNTRMLKNDKIRKDVNKKTSARKKLELMEERRQYKRKDEFEYKQIHRIIREKIKEAKEEYLKNQSEEIEQVEKNYDMYNRNKKIRDIQSRNGDGQ